MPALRELQSAVMAALRGHADGSAAAALLRATHAPAPLQRLHVYRNHLRFSGAQALAAVYPVVQRLVGEAFFRTLAYRYVDAHPPGCGNLQDFGGELSGFLYGFSPAQALPYLPDVAALEWAYHLVYHAELRPAWTVQQLADVPPAAQPGLRLALQPAARVLSSDYPVLSIWQANQPGVSDEQAQVSLAQGGQHVLVVQQDLDVEFRLLAAGEAAWLRALSQGTGLQAATLAALQADGRFDLGHVLARHAGAGLFVR